jgi:AGCS family alanine or glycine:cation symporter
MWVSAFLGMATIFGEAVLAQKFRTKKEGIVVGGPAYYISEGLGLKWLAAFFAVAIILARGIHGKYGAVKIQCGAVNNPFGISRIATGLGVALRPE